MLKVLNEYFTIEKGMKMRELRKVNGDGMRPFHTTVKVVQDILR